MSWFIGKIDTRQFKGFNLNITTDELLRGVIFGENFRSYSPEYILEKMYRSDDDLKQHDLEENPSYFKTLDGVEIKAGMYSDDGNSWCLELQIPETGVTWRLVISCDISE